NVFLFQLERAELIVDAVAEIAVLVVLEQTAKRFSCRGDVATSGDLSHLCHVQPRIKIRFILRVGRQATAVEVEGFRFKAELLVHLAENKKYPPGAIALLQKGSGLGEAAHHIVVVLLHLVEVPHFQEKVFAISLVEVLFQQVVDGGLRVVVLIMLGEGANEINNGAVPGVGVFALDRKSTRLNSSHVKNS